MKQNYTEIYRKLYEAIDQTKTMLEGLRDGSDVALRVKLDKELKRMEAAVNQEHVLNVVATTGVVYTDLTMKDIAFGEDYVSENFGIYPLGDIKIDSESGRVFFHKEDYSLELFPAGIISIERRRITREMVGL